MDFAQKTVLIVGGTSGIGYETARRFAKQGARVAVIGRGEQKTAEAAAGIAQAFPQAEIVPLHGDATDRTAMEGIFGQVRERFGTLDVLVHVAGISGRRWGDGPLHECSEQGWDVVMDANVKSVYHSNHFALRMMKEQGRGSIVNVSSVLGLVGVQEHFVTHAYAASRGAVISLSRSAAVYYAKDQIRINVVCPGLLDTPMSQRAINDPVIHEALTYFQPLPPHVGYPDDVAEAILFLASDRTKFITGTVLSVDGGWQAQ